MIAMTKTLLVLLIIYSQELMQIRIIQLYIQENINLIIYIGQNVRNLCAFILREVKIATSELLTLNYMELISNIMILNKSILVTKKLIFILKKLIMMRKIILILIILNLVVVKSTENI